IDIEHHCVLPGRSCPQEEYEKNIPTYLRLIDIVRQQLPGAKIGFYGNLGPVILGCNSRKARDPDFLEGWQKSNNVAKPITDRVDFMVPSVYHNYGWEDRDTWAACATALVQEAGRMSGGKPVYPYTKTVHNIHAPQPHKNQSLSYDYFLFTLNTLRNAGASGVTFWDGEDKPCHGINQWWPATQDFITAVRGGTGP
ncbi:MAG: hypothetical protein MN733_30890, partial [Nitrososphaera sp.]|nr:hypothetical protein [Nitrososphaera sp.]